MEEVTENTETDKEERQERQELAVETEETEIAEVIDEAKLEAIKDEPLETILEAFLFVSGEPLTIQRIAAVLNREHSEIKASLENLAKLLTEQNRAVELICAANKYQLRTRSVFAPFVRELFAMKPKKLSQPALETLAVIAYQQPVVKSEIEKVRGVDVSPTLKTLLERNLVKIIGYQATVGQPALYGTTDEFLNLFALKSLKDLPTMRLVREIENEPGEAESEEEDAGSAQQEIAA